MPNHFALLLPLLLIVACQDVGTQAQLPPAVAPVTPPAPAPTPPPTPPAATPAPTPQPTPAPTPPAPTPPPPAPPPASTDIYALNKRLARTINFGNALEAPNEGDWGMRLEEKFFQLARDGGFTAIRLPVKWSAHAAQSAPYTLAPAFLDRVRWAVRQATSRDLAIIVDFHHYEELMTAPEANRERFLGIWKNVAEAFKDAPENVFFELHNEPNGAIEPLWNAYLADALKVVRASNPTRAVIVGPNGWNSAWRLPDLKLPADDRLIVTFHNYDPFSFTHQGAEWVSPSPPTGTVWPTPGAAPRAGWQNWSWNTRLDSAGDTALGVTFQAGWAGLYLHNDSGAAGYTGLKLQTDRAVKLQVRCLEQNNQNANPPGAVVETQAGVPLSIDFKACGGSGSLHDLLIQSNSPDPQPAFTLSTLELTRADGTLNLISNSRTAVADLLDYAATWGKTNHRPLFMGEFGAYNKADLASRARWTAAVRGSAEARAISWGYWEFGAGFGVYDRTAWVEPIWKALIP